jgi:N-carbamoyl-L-amino-acid hydrolase
MPGRRDAFLAAAEIALAVESAARSTGSIDTVATVGVCEVFPGAVNSIPSRVRIEVDVRDIDGTRRDSVLKKISEACEATAAKRNVKVQSELVNADPPAQCAPAVVDALVAGCEKHNIRFDRMISRAYHDSLFMSRIRLPHAVCASRGGVSHRPDEYSSPEAIGKAFLSSPEPRP